MLERFPNTIGSSRFSSMSRTINTICFGKLKCADMIVDGETRFIAAISNPATCVPLNCFYQFYRFHTLCFGIMTQGT